MLLKERDFGSEALFIKDFFQGFFIPSPAICLIFFTLVFFWARKNAIPVLGVCRGAQVINILLKGRVTQALDTSHEATRHNVTFITNRETEICLNLHGTKETNSYHSLLIPEESLAAELTPFAFAEDASVEAFIDATHKTIGVLWHPEREISVQDHDRAILQYLFEGGKPCL